MRETKIKQIHRFVIHFLFFRFSSIHKTPKDDVEFSNKGLFLVFCFIFFYIDGCKAEIYRTVAYWHKEKEKIMSKMRQYSFTGIKEVGFTISRDEKAALEMYFRLCRTGTDRDTAFEKVSAHFGAKLASEAIPWKR